jgi:hypothetical protein
VSVRHIPRRHRVALPAAIRSVHRLSEDGTLDIWIRDDTSTEEENAEVSRIMQLLFGRPPHQGIAVVAALVAAGSARLGIPTQFPTAVVTGAATLAGAAAAPVLFGGREGQQVGRPGENRPLAVVQLYSPPVGPEEMDSRGDRPRRGPGDRPAPRLRVLPILGAVGITPHSAKRRAGRPHMIRSVPVSISVRRSSSVEGTEVPPARRLVAVVRRMGTGRTLELTERLG